MLCVDARTLRDPRACGVVVISSTASSLPLLNARGRCLTATGAHPPFNSPQALSQASAPALDPSKSGAVSEIDVEQYHNDLRQLRALRDELQSWSDQYMNETGHRPSMADVRNARIPWLTQRFQEYRSLQVKLLQITPKLRGALAAAGPAGLQGGSGLGGAAGGGVGGAGAARSLLVAENEEAAPQARPVDAAAGPAPAPAAQPAAAAEEPPKRRTRKPKAAAADAATAAAPQATAAAAEATAAAELDAAPAKKPRGRPRRKPAVQQQATDDDEQPPSGGQQRGAAAAAAVAARS